MTGFYGASINQPINQSINWYFYSMYHVPGNVQVLGTKTGEKTDSPTHGTGSPAAKTDTESYVGLSFWKREG